MVDAVMSKGGVPCLPINGIRRKAISRLQSFFF